MYQLKFTLKQHTPIIHFQHDQVGATLRATEVKPKLDRFIYNKWLKEKNNDAEAIFKTFGHLTVGYTVDKMKKEIEEYDKMDDAKKKKYLENFKWALDYKMRVENSLKEDESLRLEFEENSKEQDISKKWIVKKKNTNFPMILANMAGKPSARELKDLRLYDSIQCVIIAFSQQLTNCINKNLLEFFSISNFGNRNNKGFGSYSVTQIAEKL